MNDLNLGRDLFNAGIRPQKLMSIEEFGKTVRRIVHNNETPPPCEHMFVHAKTGYVCQKCGDARVPEEYDMRVALHAWA